MSDDDYEDRYLDEIKQLRVELALARAELVGMRAALDGVRLLAASYARNAPLLRDALRKAGLDHSWLNSWEAKFERVHAALEKASRADPARTPGSRARSAAPAPPPVPATSRRRL